MQVELTLGERFLLELWLPKESEPGQIASDARSLVAQARPVSAGDVPAMLGKVRQCLGDLQSARSMLDVRPPLGRGKTLRIPGPVEISWMSRWEEVWLVVDRVKSAGGFDAPFSAVSVVQTQLNTTFLNAVLLCMLCCEDAAEAEELARALSSHEQAPSEERVWLLWLAGDHTAALADNLTAELVGEAPTKAITAALRGDWLAAEGFLPKALRKPQSKAIKPSGTTMFTRFLAQLVSHALHQQPPREVVQASLATLFSYFGATEGAAWHEWHQVAVRLSLLALYGRQFEPGVAGARLLHAQRVHNAHLLDPPPRTFVVPDEVVAAVNKLALILAAAVEARAGLQIALFSDRNVYTLALPA